MSKKLLLPCLVASTLTVVAFVVALMNPATGYEISIYASTPLSVWALIAISVIICVLLLTKEASNEASNRWWLFPLVLLMVNGSLVLMVAMVRGFYSIDGDTLMHIGYVRDLADGIVSGKNAYPGLHVIPSFLTIIGVSPNIATNLSSVVWYVVYVVSFYALAKMLWDDKRKIIIATALSAMLLFPVGIGLAGTLVGVAMFPLLLIILLRLKRNFNTWNIIPLVVYMAVISWFHPLALEVACIALVVACLLSLGNRWKLVGLAIVLLPLAVWWYEFRDPVFSTIGLLENVYRAISHGNVPSLLPSAAGMEATQDVGNFSGVSLILRRYGLEIVIACLAIIFVFLKRHIKGFPPNTRYFVGLFMVLNIMWLAGWYLELQAYELILSRMLYWITPLSIILATPLLAWLISSRRWCKLSVAVILAILSVGSLFHVYPSHITGTSSPLVTNQQVKGFEWVVDNGKSDVPVTHLNMRETSRIVASMYGAEWCNQHGGTYWLPESDYLGLGQFSYNDKSSIGYWYPEDVYVVVTKLARLLPSWEGNKLYLLEDDTAATLVYKDGDELEIYYIRHTES